MNASPSSILVIACGALAREFKLLKRRDGWGHISLRCLPAALHNTPDEIPAAIRQVLEETAGRFTETFVAYGDCGTGGRLDSVLKEFGVKRLPGAHCYEFFAGVERFAAFQNEEPGTFYLTDFLVRHFDRLVIRGLGLDRHPELLPQYFGHYKRVVHLAQVRSSKLREEARACAERLGLEFESHFTDLEAFSRGVEFKNFHGPDEEQVD